MAQTPESFNQLVDILGEGAARKLCEAVGGEAIYIPKLDTVDNARRILDIRAEFNGANTPFLARKYGLTTRRIQQIVEAGAPTLPGRVDMFGL